VLKYRAMKVNRGRGETVLTRGERTIPLSSRRDGSRVFEDVMPLLRESHLRLPLHSLSYTTALRYSALSLCLTKYHAMKTY